MDDLDIARKYVNKANNAASKGLSFNLSFTAFKNMCKAKRCRITGIELTHSTKKGNPAPTELTIDRIDNSKGYESGNVVAVAHCVNQFKSVIENPNTSLNLQQVKKIVLFMEKKLNV